MQQDIWRLQWLTNQLLIFGATEARHTRNSMPDDDAVRHFCWMMTFELFLIARERVLELVLRLRALSRVRRRLGPRVG